MMKQPVNRRFMIEIPLLCAAGILLWYLTSRNTGASETHTIPDLCFAVGSVFLIRGIVALLNQNHAFTRTADSFRFVHRIFRGKTKAEEEAATVPAKEKPEPDRRLAPVYLITAGSLIAVSVLVSVL